MTLLHAQLTFRGGTVVCDGWRLAAVIHNYVDPLFSFFGGKGGYRRSIHFGLYIVWTLECVSLWVLFCCKLSTQKFGSFYDLLPLLFTPFTLYFTPTITIAFSKFVNSFVDLEFELRRFGIEST